MPEIQNAVRAAASEKTRAKHHIRLAGKNRREQQVIFTRIIFQIRVLDDDDLRVGMGDARAQRRTLALIGFVLDELDARFGLSEGLEFVPGAVL